MSYELICHTRPRARTHHRCDHCECSIAPGEVYDRIVGRYEGDFCASKAHLDCETMFQTRLRDQGEIEGVFLIQDEWDRGELNYYRGYFPHVVTRLELSRELAAERWKRKL